MNTLLAVTAIGILALVSEIINFRKLLFVISIVGLLVATGLAIYDWDTGIRYFSDMMYFDNYAITFSIVLTFTTLLWFMMGENFLRNNPKQADLTALVAFSLGGAIVMVSFADLIMLFLGIEILSVSMYVLAASNKNEFRSGEAGFKYFLMGVFASGFLLFGITLIYGVTASFNLREIASFVSTHAAELPVMLNAGVLLIIVGMAFKVAAAPFHFWAPDVYEGTPTPFTAYMVTVVKTAAFAAFLRLFLVCFSGTAGWWGPVLAVMAAASMLIGNIIAVNQKSFKRMLAYSSVAHAGYMMMAIIGANQFSAGSLLIYTAAYSVASIGIFSLVISMTRNQNEMVSSLKGFSRVNQLPALSITILMLSLAGIPPVAGFFGKYYVFTGVLQSGYLWLVLIAIVSSLIGVYYYFRVIITLFLPADRESVQYSISPSQSIILGITLFLTLLIGIAPVIFNNLI